MKYFTRSTIPEVKKGEYRQRSRSVLLLGSGVGTGDQESAKGSDSDGYVGLEGLWYRYVLAFKAGFAVY